MSERFLIIGEDERMKFLAKELSNVYPNVYYKKTNTWDEALNKVVLEFHPTKIVLPIHPLAIEVDELLGIRHAEIYAGRLNDKWAQQLQHIKQYDYLQDELFIWKNAALTAEGLLAHLYKERVSVQHKKIIITGFGRVSKMLALFLSRLRANVQIAVRSEAQNAEAIAYGYDGIIINEATVHDADLLINTIPTPWLTKEFLSWSTCPIYDVASAPGCLKDVVLSQYELLPALPGKYFPQAAAKILFETIVALGKDDDNT
ncbi:dipicolinate synthase subunit A [Lysinibacillus sp. 2017]|uniref:dipicolinate synthase subunit A n=1 Tax=unclassified Lysinibacillus TaxID=2636778 RepID=UPI000D5272BA|nr:MULTISPECIES: dipicolinate synthase subunit A [unclassified Lysinibacillus]AWE06729.1 dipicolinate synthase subunit A [Lysinibacillus sp. 2017]TGN37338.1 dipicolinate synthase subunit A [Lysinibacillus sp. S2017]